MPAKRKARRKNASRFEKCVAKVAAKGTARSPRGVCAAAGRKKYGAKKFAAMAAAGRRKKRRNPGDAEAEAAAVSEMFHGRPAKQVTDYDEPDASRRVLADLGRLIELVVLDDDDREITLAPFRGVRCACTPEQDQHGKPIGRTIYFIGGDQAIDLEAFGIDEVKDQVRLGDVLLITYHTSKAFHEFEPNDYEHQFGEESGNLPTLNYDTLNQRLFLVGGSYEVHPEGITD